MSRISQDNKRQAIRKRGMAAAKLHLTLAVGLSLCVAAFVIEVLRALGGNELSWCYVFEWPIFAVFGTYMWWNILHGYDEYAPSRRIKKVVAQPTAEELRQIEAWNSYLERLNGGSTSDTNSRP